MRLIAAIGLAGALAGCPALVQAHTNENAVDAGSVGAWVALAVAGAVYARAVLAGAALRPRHAAAFAAGWLAAASAAAPPMAQAAADSFAVHMVQHEVLMVVAPPLLILGRPFTALAATLPPKLLRLAAFPLRVPPIAAWLLHAAALWIWHVPRLFDAGAASDAIHALQHASFFWSALLFWWAVLRRVRTGVAVLFILTTMIHAGALAALLVFAPSPLYAGATLEQQQLGGLIMWVPGGYAMLLAGLLAFARLLKPAA
jgi:cytochrome c oxidase assembly factor CtaG